MRRSIEDKSFLLLVVVISLAFGWILWPFYGAILWGVVIAVVFAPLSRRLSALMPQRPTLAALATVLIIVFIVILPLTLVIASLAQEAASVYEKIQSKDLDLVRSFQEVLNVLPSWATSLLERFGLASLGAVQDKLSAGLLKGSQFIATQALNVGQSTFDFVLELFIMICLLFFL
ncbi:MAG TPA: AI-2E family transporter, partial [Rhodopseudomonas sp.]|uniref:AI-2E family transporter n=1 Tax=Rhodopseudomonas sp. TaxID=1078 RepID=UPI002EDB3A9E